MALLGTAILPHRHKNAETRSPNLAGKPTRALELAPTPTRSSPALQVSTTLTCCAGLEPTSPLLLRATQPREPRLTTDTYTRAWNKINAHMPLPPSLNRPGGRHTCDI